MAASTNVKASTSKVHANREAIQPAFPKKEFNTRKNVPKFGYH